MNLRAAASGKEDAYTDTYLHALRQRVIGNILKTSRTAESGAVDATVSQEKEAVQVQPSLVVDAIERAMEFVIVKCVTDHLGECTASGIRDIIEGAAVRVQQGTLGVQLTSAALRRHPVPYGRKVLPGEIEREWGLFVGRLASDLTRTADPIDLAAWVEKEIDYEIHPFSDGCGRISKLVSMMVLLISRQAAPVLPARAVYYSAMEGKMACPSKDRQKAVDAYLKSLPNEVAKSFQSASPQDQFALCYRFWMNPRS